MYKMPKNKMFIKIVVHFCKGSAIISIRRKAPESNTLLHIFREELLWALVKSDCLQRDFFFGTAGIKILTSEDAKKLYTHTTAAVLRAKEDIMTTVTNMKENAGDIVADAREINDKRKTAAKAEVIEDECCCCAEEAEDCCCDTTEESCGCPCCTEDTTVE